MSWELDHVFICCSAGGPEAEALRRAGLREGSPNSHPGQGTSCRRFFFSNAYLELMWVSDEAEARSPTVARARLWDRWAGRSSGACPYAMVLRPAPGTDPGAPFDTWPYRPPYMPGDLAIEVALGTPIEGPAFFYLGFQRGPARVSQEPRNHGLPCGTLTGVTAYRPPSGNSPAAAAVAQAGIASFVDAEQHRLELTFADGNRGVLDVRPELPLVLRW